MRRGFTDFSHVYLIQKQSGVIYLMILAFLGFAGSLV